MAKPAKYPLKMSATPYDVADHLRPPQEAAAYLEAWLQEAPDDVMGIAKAVENVARAKAASQVEKDAGLSRDKLDQSPVTLQRNQAHSQG